MSEWLDTSNSIIPDCRIALLGGARHVSVGLGLTIRAAHIERGERECLSAAAAALSTYTGPAARIIEAGAFAGITLGPLLGTLERPKAGIVMTTNLDLRQFERLRTTDTTAELTHLHHDATQYQWPLAPIGTGTTLLFMGGGGFGFTQSNDAFTILENASQSLTKGDMIAVTLEMDRDGAVLDAVYCDFGHQIVNQALTSLGKAEGLEPRTFYDPTGKRVRFGAVATKGASISWNGTRCTFEGGAWLDVGAMALHTVDTMGDLHPDFEARDQWQSHDKAVTLLLLRKT